MFGAHTWLILIWGPYNIEHPAPLVELTKSGAFRYLTKINLKEGAIPTKQQRYIMNPNYAKLLKEEIDRQLRVEFIYLVEKATWISPIVIVPKNNNKIKKNSTLENAFCSCQ